MEDVSLAHVVQLLRLDRAQLGLLAFAGKPCVQPVALSALMNADPRVASQLVERWMQLGAMVLEHLQQQQQQQQEQPTLPLNTKLWLRLDAAPAHYTTIPQLLDAVRDRGPHMASFTGVVQAQTTLMQDVYSRVLT